MSVLFSFSFVDVVVCGFLLVLLFLWCVGDLPEWLVFC